MSSCLAASYKNTGAYPYELQSLDKLESSPNASTGKEMDKIPFPLKMFLPNLLKTFLRTLFCAWIFYLFVLISSPLEFIIHYFYQWKCPPVVLGTTRLGLPLAHGRTGCLNLSIFNEFTELLLSSKLTLGMILGLFESVFLVNKLFYLPELLV